MKLNNLLKKVFIIAELSANHNQDINIAIETIKAAKKAGADAIKLQTYTPDTMTINIDNKYFRIKDNKLWSGQTLYDLYKKAYTPWEWFPKLKEIAEREGLVFFSTPFDRTAVDFLEKLNVKLYKIASFELVDLPLIEYVASKNKPIIISTGMANLIEIQEAIDTIRKYHNKIAILKCTSAYPAKYKEMNLKAIKHLEELFNLQVGLSDHSLGISVPVAAVALGAKIIEKHFILDKKLGGPDAAFSLDKKEFKEMVRAVRETEQAIGKINYDITETEKKSILFRRSIFVVKDMKKNEKFTKKNIRIIRPGYGLKPKYYDLVLNRKVKRNIKKGTPLKWELIE